MATSPTLTMCAALQARSAPAEEAAGALLQTVLLLLLRLPCDAFQTSY
jgi:hypothetical protein